MYRWSRPSRERVHIGLGVLALGAILLTFTGWEWMRLGGLRRERIILTRILGYDGCLCRDCWPRYAVGPDYGSYAHGGLADAELTNQIWFTGVAGLLLTGALVCVVPCRVGEPNCCATCGYSTIGLPTQACPECGAGTDNP